MSVWEINAWKLFLAGGPVMWPILLCSIFSLGIFFERLWYFSVVGANTQKLKADVFSLLRRNKIKEAINLLETNPSPVAKILKAGILKLGSSREEIKETIDDVGHFEIPRLESRLSALATIANVAPLLGLLGTVAGITSSFHTISVRSNTSNPVSQGELIGGIGEALICTLGGLVVAIISFIGYNYCLSRVKNLTLEMERAATELVNFLSQMSDTQTIKIGEE